jgi:hypothetical protein
MGRDGDLIEIRPDQLERGERPLAAAENEWKPGSKEYAVMVTLSVISLMVALDATILVSVLPVCHQPYVYIFFIPSNPD